MDLDERPRSTTSGTPRRGGGYYGDPDCTDGGAWDSARRTAGYQFSQTFTTAGTYQYFCAVHGSAMVGSMVVEAATDTTPTVTPTPGGPTPTPGSFGVEQRPIGTEATGRP